MERDQDAMLLRQLVEGSSSPGALQRQVQQLRRESEAKDEIQTGGDALAEEVATPVRRPTGSMPMTPVKTSAAAAMPTACLQDPYMLALDQT